jgi:uncharacterized membrane protein
MLDPELGLSNYQAYCAFLVRHATTVGKARSPLCNRGFDEVPELVPLATVALGVGKPF